MMMMEYGLSIRTIQIRTYVYVCILRYTRKKGMCVNVGMDIDCADTF